jgi:hypothetical protein
MLIPKRDLTMQEIKKKSYLMIGAGKWGNFARIVVGGLKEKAAEIHLVDIDRDAVSLSEELGIELFTEDGIKRVIRLIEEERLHYEWIIPNLPRHLVFEVAFELVGRERRTERIPIPETRGFPNPFMGKNGEVYASLAEGICPQDCQGPYPVCPVTPKPRKRHLYEVLQDLQFEAHEHLVVRSHQLAPGTGGVKSRDLLNLLDAIKSRGKKIISTSCECHSMTAAMSVVW